MGYVQEGSEMHVHAWACFFCSVVVHVYDFVATLGFALKSCYHLYPLVSSCIHLLLCVPQAFVQIW